MSSPPALTFGKGVAMYFELMYALSPNKTKSLARSPSYKHLNKLLASKARQSNEDPP
jgi:hypothetical protein